VTTQTLQNDPDVKLPKGVLEAAARAEELHKTMRDVPEPEQEDVTSQGNSELDPASLASTSVDTSQQPETAAKETERPAAGEESWEHKYKSIHGRYVRSQEQVRELSERVSNLQNMLASMQATAATAPTQVPELSAENLITPEEANDYGEDFLKVVGKKAREELAPVINAYQAEIAKLKQQLEGVQGVFRQDSHQKLLGTLDEKLPNWRDLNTNEVFLDWLRLPDPYSGAIRHDMLKAAYAQGDARRVLAFFNGFLAEEAAVAPAGAEPDPSVTRVPNIPLANLAAPGRAKTAASSTGPAEKPIFTRAQIAAFYADVAAGKYRGRDADKGKAEAMIFEAQREGRIR
jgi:prefoldin subunit 5